MYFQKQGHSSKTSILPFISGNPRSYHTTNPIHRRHSNVVNCPNNVSFSVLAPNPIQEHKLPRLTSVLLICDSPQCSPDFRVPESTALSLCRMALSVSVQTQVPPSWQQCPRCGTGLLLVRQLRRHGWRAFPPLMMSTASTWSSPSLPAFSTVKLPPYCVTGKYKHLVGKILRLCQYLVLCQTYTS